MRFLYLGFTQQVNVRCFRFQGVIPTERPTEASPRAEFTLDADMSLLAQYHIPLQEMPALCLAILTARQDTAARSASYALTRDDLSEFTSRRTAIEEAKAARRKPRAPVKPAAPVEWKWPTRMG